MANPSQQQFGGTYPSWPQANASCHYLYHPAIQLAPTPSQYSPGRFHYPPVVGQPAVQMLSQELAAAQRRLSQYTDLIANLYTELETIRDIVCNNCKERVSSVNLAQNPLALASQVHIVTAPESPNVGREQAAPAISPHTTVGTPVTCPLSSEGVLLPQTSFPNTELTYTGPSFSIPTNLVAPAIPNAIPNAIPTLKPSNPPEAHLPPLETSPTKPMKETGVVAQKSQWTVTYNNDIEKVLDITFVHALKHSTSSVCAVRFSRDGNFLAAGVTHDLGTAHIYDLKTRSLRCALTEYPGYSYKKGSPSLNIWGVCFSPDGRYLVVGGSFPMIYIWEIARKRVLAAFKGHGRSFRSLDISPNGRLLVTGSSDRSVRLWKMHDGSSRILADCNLFLSLRFSPNGRYVVASNNDSYLRIWNVRSGQLVGKWNGHDARISCVGFTPNGEELVSGCWDGTVKSWDVSSLKAAAPSTIKEHTVGDDILVQTKEKLKFDGHLGRIRSVSTSPDSKWVITGSSDKGVSIWDARTAVLRCTLKGHVDELSAVDFSPVGNYIATGSEDGFVTLWKYQTV